MRCNNVYTLPQINFVAGQTKSLRFYLWTEDGQYFNGSECSANFSIVHYSNKTSAPIISKDMTFELGDETAVYNIAKVDLNTNDTLNLNGKYIYQITIVDRLGKSDIPNKGIFLITDNINKGYLEN